VLNVLKLAGSYSIEKATLLGKTNIGQFLEVYNFYSFSEEHFESEGTRVMTGEGSPSAFDIHDTWQGIPLLTMTTPSS